MTNIEKYEEKKEEMQTLKVMASIAVNSGKYGSEYNESTILNIFLTAKSLEVDPLIALNGGFNIIQGKINMSAHFMSALVRRRGHSIKVLEITEKKCVIIGQRKDNGDSLKYEYTWEEAQRAELTGKKNWRTNPKQMLYCGCIRNIFRMLFSDIGIAYDEDEMSPQEIDDNSESVEITVPVEINESDKVFDFQEIKEKISEDGTSTDLLEEYINFLATTKKISVDEVIKTALIPSIFEPFKSSYIKEIARRSQASQ